MTTTYDTDPNTQTIAAAWASSELGQPDHEVGFDTTGPTELATISEEEPIARRVMVATGVGCGIAAGALLGVMLFANTGSSQPTVAAPGRLPARRGRRPEHYRSCSETRCVRAEYSADCQTSCASHLACASRLAEHV